MFESWVSTPAFVFDCRSGLLRLTVVQRICPEIGALLCIDVFRHKNCILRSVSHVPEKIYISRIIFAAKCASVTFLPESDARY